MKVDKGIMAGSTTLMVLSLLNQREMYGYEMILELANRSEHTFELKEGTLYPILHGLEDQSLVTVFEQEADTGHMRKYYHITKKGGKALEEKTAEWKYYTEKVNAVVYGAGPSPA